MRDEALIVSEVLSLLTLVTGTTNKQTETIISAAEDGFLNEDAGW